MKTKIFKKKFKASIVGFLGAAMSASALAAGSHADSHASASIGMPGKAANVSRTIQVDMSDAMRFNPSNVSVKQGETIKFVVKNSGKLQHEMILGTLQDIKAHAELMKKNPGMEHEDDNQISLKAGQTGELIWKFTKSGPVSFACLEPGHLEAGMKGSVNVTAKRLTKSTASEQTPHNHKH